MHVGMNALKNTVILSILSEQLIRNQPQKTPKRVIIIHNYHSNVAPPLTHIFFHYVVRSYPKSLNISPAMRSNAAISSGGISVFHLLMRESSNEVNLIFFFD